MPGKVGYKDNIGQVFDNIKGGHTSNGFMNCEIQFFYLHIEKFNGPIRNRKKCIDVIEESSKFEFRRMSIQ